MRCWGRELMGVSCLVHRLHPLVKVCSVAQVEAFYATGTRRRWEETQGGRKKGEVGNHGPTLRRTATTNSTKKRDGCELAGKPTREGTGAEGNTGRLRRKQGNRGRWRGEEWATTEREGRVDAVDAHALR